MNEILIASLVLLAAVALVCVIVAALSYSITQWLGYRALREMVSADIDTQAYKRIKQEFDWQAKLFKAADKYPAIEGLEYDPDGEIVPFVPMKRIRK